MVLENLYFGIWSEEDKYLYIIAIVLFFVLKINVIDMANC